MSNSFYILQNLPFSKANNAKNNLFNYFYIFITIIISIILKSNFTKEKEMYKHIWTYFKYNYTCL